MSTNTGIEWTDATWNPIRGCSRVSEGCRNCYAEKIAARFSHGGQPYEGLATITRTSRANEFRWAGEVRFIPEKLEEPLHWRKPKRVFVNSMSDLFHEKVQEESIRQIFDVMLMAQRHTFQILTKRPERMLEFMRKLPDPSEHWPNVWLGVSVEDQKTADERIPVLMNTPAAVRWVSYEPALGPVDFGNWLLQPHGKQYGCESIDWIVAGGESGPGARPAHPDWFRSARDQCAAVVVPFFFKQWGAWSPGRQAPISNSKLINVPCRTIESQNCSVGTFKVGKKAAGRLLDGREHNEYPA